MNCHYGRNLKVCGRVFFRPGHSGCFKIGNNVTITARFLTNSVGITNPALLESIGSGKIEIGDNSGLSSTIISARELISIGKNVKIGGNVRIFDHDFHSLDFHSRRNSTTDYLSVKTARVFIGDDVFIGTNVIILKGVRIGARTIIAAGSVVALKNIPPDSMVAGNPAVILKRKH